MRHAPAILAAALSIVAVALVVVLVANGVTLVSSTDFRVTLPALPTSRPSATLPPRAATSSPTPVRSASATAVRSGSPTPSPMGGMKYVALDRTTGWTYVADTESGRVTARDADGRTMATSASLGWSMGIGVDPDRSRVYVAIAGTGATRQALYALDARSLAQVGATPITAPTRLAVDPGRDRVYVSFFGVGQVVAYTGSTLTKIGSVDVNSAGELALSPDGTRLYVAAYGYSSGLFAVDPDRLSATRTSVRSAGPMVVDAKRVHVLSGTSIVSLDVASGQTYSTVLGSSGAAIAVDRTAPTAYVAHDGGRSISVVDLDSRSVVRIISVPGHGVSVAVDPQRRGVYVALREVPAPYRIALPAQ